MSTSSLEAERLARVTLLDRRTVAEMLAIWRALDLDDLQGSFLADVLPAELDVLTQAQLDAADVGADYAIAMAAIAGAPDGPDVNRAALVGVASDGRDLPGLLSQPLVDLFKALAVGVPAAPAMEFSQQSLERIAVTQIHDTARAAEQVADTANSRIRGYLRLVEPKACGRCIILAGRFYRWNEGFKRHPRCRCTHKPITGGWTDADQDPRELFEALSPAEQERAFTKAGAEAIRLGADPASVVNARRGMTTATSPSGRQLLTRRDVLGQQVFTTTVGTGRTRAERRKAPVRLMPESILELAASREEAIRLLTLHRYIN